MLCPHAQHPGTRWSREPRPLTCLMVTLREEKASLRYKCRKWNLRLRRSPNSTDMRRSCEASASRFGNDQQPEIPPTTPIQGPVPQSPISLMGRVPQSPISLMGRVPQSPISLMGRVPQSPISLMGRVPQSPISLMGRVPQSPISLTVD